MELHRLLRSIGVVREWDVFIAGGVFKNISGRERKRLRLPGAKASRKRKKASRKSAADVGGKRFRNLIRHLDAYAVLVRDGESVTTSMSTDEELHGPVDPPVSTFAKELLVKYYEKVEKKMRGASDLDGPHLHTLRIQVKKLRYVAEFFRDLYPARSMRRLLSTLATFQDQLGEIHDFYVAQSKLDRRHPKKINRDVATFRGNIDTLAKLTVAEEAVGVAAAAIGVDRR